MKKILAFLTAICLMASVFCVTASAATMSSDDVIWVLGLKKDGKTVFIKGETDFATGWELAVDYANNSSYMETNGYDRIVVDLLADWNANDSGEFGKSSWTGFQNSTICVPGKTRLMINLNGHTINRGKKTWEHDGEVICINAGADVIINGGKIGDPIIKLGEETADVKMGTIKGGWSCNGAGGIHMQDDSKLILNNVNIDGNVVEDDDGGGLAVYDGATLIMNGGSIANNLIKSTNVSWVYGGGIYVEDSTASFYNVTFKHNHSGGKSEHERDHSETYSTYGTAIYADESNVTIDTCYFYDNGHQRGNFLDAECVIYLDDSKLIAKNTVFQGNGGEQHFTNGYTSVYLSTKLFNTYKSDLIIEKCQFVKNNASVLLDLDSKSYLNVSDTYFTDNNTSIYCGSVASAESSSFNNCTFDRNYTQGKYPHSFEFDATGNQPTFVDCNFGNSSFSDRSRATFLDTDTPNGPGSIFGDGSIAVIIAIIALAASVASIAVNVSSRKDAKETADEK